MHYVYLTALFGFACWAQSQALKQCETAGVNRHQPGTLYYFKAALLWGVLSSVLLKGTIILLEDRSFANPVSDARYLVIYCLTNFLICFGLGQQLVSRPFGAISWLLILLLVSACRTFDLTLYATMMDAESLQDVPAIFERLAPLHVISVIFYSLIFYGLLRVGSFHLTHLEIEGASRQSPQQPAKSFFDNSRIQVLFFIVAANVLLIGVDRCMLQMAQTDSIPLKFYRMQWSLAIWGMLSLIYAFIASAHNRQKLKELADKCMWQSTQYSERAEDYEIHNMKLMGRALQGLGVSLFVWKSPNCTQQLNRRSLLGGQFYVTTEAPYARYAKNSTSLYSTWGQSVHPEDKTDFLNSIEQCLITEKSVEVIARFRAADEKWHIYKVQAHFERLIVNFSKVLVLYGSHQDITQQVLENQYLSSTNVRQLNALRMIGHDLATPLSVIVMNSVMLSNQAKQKLLDTEQTKRSIERIAKASSQGLRYLENTLTYVKSSPHEQKLKPEKLDLDELIEEIVTLQAERFSFGTKQISTEIDEQFRTVRILRFPLELILNNLLSNAIKFSTEPKSQIHLKVQPEEVENRLHMLISIEDEGLGIPPEQRDILFINHQRATNVQAIKGAGLGLGIVSNAAQLLGASIRIISKPERIKGTCVQVSIPLEVEYDPRNEKVVSA